MHILGFKMSISLSPKTVLQWPDYTFIVFILGLCVVISVYFNRRNKGAVQNGRLAEFLLAGRRLSVLPAACSIAATMITPMILTVLSSDLYLYGIQTNIFLLSMAIGTILIAYFVVPVYRNMPYVTVFQVFLN